ncbi:MAG: NAD dependent epimerase/dehydratase family protein [Berkelbacteria bacterium GW2011_GWA1_36_9]|uniref:NAD dependent epimerase/dehydratase family protein n=1 Tax=Berkelbacteria bacterium GW2011_GWA1_36_9 TaxID=1618331 RepID=A0A0G0IRY1_9BACT|nr:MAG: NAD dependent epimerase/dehydratase family protein [Berkelbacteria bacterium GW2011_GWA1_36_9]
MGLFSRKRILITGGTGSLGKILVKRLLSGEEGCPEKIIIFSRDEAKQHEMRLTYQHKKNPTDEVIYNNFQQMVEFRIGDVRNYDSICPVLKNVDIVINTAALKQVPSCEYFPFEAVRTNIIGAENIIRALRENDFPVSTVVGVSTDKACKPVNVMGMTKALQERLFISANIFVPKTRFICVRYGNVLASRGSVIPMFHEQIKNNLPLTVTTQDMTRFLLPLNQAVDTVFVAIANAGAGETYIPKVRSSSVMNLAEALIEKRSLEIKITGIRPGEKIHEILISEEEVWHTVERGNYYVIKPILPELMEIDHEPFVVKIGEYSSAQNPMDLKETSAMLEQHHLFYSNKQEEGELLK